MTTVKYLFESQALGAETLEVIEFSGHEAISEPYEFVIDLKSSSAEIDAEAMLDSPCTFTMEIGDHSRPIHGILSEFEQLHQIGEYTLYQAKLVPQLWKLSLYHLNEVYLDLDIKGIIQAIMQDCGISANDYEIKLTESYPTWEYRCQFGETYLQYISRMTEHLGIYFYFEQGDSAEKIIFSDSSNHQVTTKQKTLYYSPQTGLAQSDTNIARTHTFKYRSSRVPKKMMVRDYNYRKPTLDIEGNATVDDHGLGEVFIYGDNFDTPEEGEWLAQVRADEVGCFKSRFEGESDAHHLAAGYSFHLEKHYKTAFNQEYLVTEIKHQGAMPSHLVSSDRPAYLNSFHTIPFSQQFRPPRKTNKPKFYGTLNAVIDAEQDGKYAEINEEGEYKVLLPFDRRDAHGGKASHWVRMAQPYGGSQEGMFFPLRKGTPVLLTFINGDPDQPIISAVVPNATNRSIVNEESKTNSRIQSAAGNLIEIEDKEDHNRIKLSSPEKNTYFHLGKANHDGDGWVVHTDGIQRFQVKGGQQLTYWTTTASGVDKSKASVTRGTASKQTQDSQGTWKEITSIYKFPKRSQDGSWNGTSYLTQTEEIGGGYFIERYKGDKYSFFDGNIYNYTKKRKIWNFGKNQTISVWNPNDQDKGKKLLETMKKYNLTGLKSSPSGITATTWSSAIEKGSVELSQIDTFTAQNGNIYDFGGYWNYNLGNSYEENHLDQNNVAINATHPKDLAVKGGPPDQTGYRIESVAPTGAPQTISLDKDRTWISKTIGGEKRAGAYDYSTKIDSVEVSHHCKSASISYGGFNAEIAYTGEGIKVAESWSREGESEERTFDRTAGALMTFTKESNRGGGKAHFGFAFAAEVNMDISFGAVQSTAIRGAGEVNIDVFGGLKLEIGMFAGGSTDIKLGTGIIKEGRWGTAVIDMNPSAIELKNLSADLQAQISQVSVNKESIVKINDAALLLTNRVTALETEQAALKQRSVNVESSQKVDL